MNGQMSRYKESLKNTPKPVMPSQFAGTRIDLKGLLAYAKAKGVSPADLSEQEKERFVSVRERPAEGISLREKTFISQFE